MTPDIAAGHSLGEYSALVAAGALSFADAVRTVRLRGQFMQEAVPLGEGGMAAILGLDGDKIKEICASVSRKVALSRLSTLIALARLSSPALLRPLKWRLKN